MIECWLVCFHQYFAYSADEKVPLAAFASKVEADRLAEMLNSEDRSLVAGHFYTHADEVFTVVHVPAELDERVAKILKGEAS